MNNTLELILNKLNDIQDNVKQLNDKVNALEETTKQEINKLREETKQGIEQLDCNINTTRRVLNEQIYKNTVEIERLRIVK
ncbi:hypothetical protein [Paraclostridium sordellii]|uniref:hypothetical protein n=1 Tax=Paraclostridium sordellii TaxID=1505 RepID=UPI0005DB67AE|nr:hypothetical protein [Paeniclostridium sordellii]CEQ26742.1 Uncharacterised protein [[Clostridium] sordellii] [Paeniclostridium sordellii]